MESNVNVQRNEIDGYIDALKPLTEMFEKGLITKEEYFRHYERLTDVKMFQDAGKQIEETKQLVEKTKQKAEETKQKAEETKQKEEETKQKEEETKQLKAKEETKQEEYKSSWLTPLMIAIAVSFGAGSLLNSYVNKNNVSEEVKE